MSIPHLSSLIAATLLSISALAAPKPEMIPKAQEPFWNLLNRLRVQADRISRTGPTEQDLAQASASRAEPDSMVGRGDRTCVRASVMTRKGMLNIRECFAGKIQMYDLGQWIEYGNYAIPGINAPGEVFSVISQQPGVLILQTSRDEVASVFFDEKSRTIGEIVLLANAAR
ncbi:hypothetical protein [Chitinimonas lacunae]|uniref:Uncharacterized protein n=1 Tax=Chitinimonas lacunae TaxID=1963018 RepID=A0ABV8MQY2_9NEIS